MSEYYKISGERLTGIADQVRRLLKAEDSMTPEQIENNLLNVVSASDLPDAESGVFGDNDASVEFGFSINEGKSIADTGGGYEYYFSTTYKANEALSILGVRLFHYYNRSDLSVYLWNASGVLVGQIDGVAVAYQSYTDVYFSIPASIAIGEEFTISVSKEIYSTKISKSYVTMNSKIAFVRSNYDYADGKLPSINETTSYLYGIGCPIIGTIDTVELPDEYKIDRSTMDDIANEVKRITETTGKFTPEQIITALQALLAQNAVLPPIPADVLAEYPYALIRKNITTSYYQLYCTKGRGYYNPDASTNNGGIVHGDTLDSGEFTSYQIPIASANAESEWIYSKDGTGWLGIDANRAIMWSNYDIPNGSATATDIYFAASPLIV